MSNGNQTPSNILSRLLYNTVRLTGKTVGYSADIISNTAEVAVVAPARSVGSLLTSKPVPFGKKRRIKERMTQLRIEIAKLERRIGARMAANVAEKMVDPADDDQIRTWMKEMEVRKKEMHELAGELGLKIAEPRPLATSAEPGEAESARQEVTTKETPVAAQDEAVESAPPAPSLAEAPPSSRAEEQEEIARLQGEKEDLQARVGLLQEENVELVARLRELEEDAAKIREELDRRREEDLRPVDMESGREEPSLPVTAIQEEVESAEPQPPPAPEPAIAKEAPVCEQPLELVGKIDEEAEPGVEPTAVQPESEEVSPVSTAAKEPPPDEESREPSFTTSYEKLIFEQAVRDSRHDDPHRRRAAIRQVEKIKNPAVTSLIISLTEDREPAVRLQALEALLHLPDKSMFPVFVKSLRDESPRVRLAAVRGLYQLDPCGAKRHLIKALEDEDPAVRRRAVTCLHWARADEALPNLIKRLVDPDVNVRRAVIHALEDLKSKLAISELIKRLDDSDTEVRRCAYQALTRLTQQQFAFNPSGSKRERAKAVANMESWWKANRGKFRVA